MFFAATTFAARAEDDAGKNEYMNACAICHGESAQGNGQFAELLNVDVPGLTGLTAANDGEFPFLKTMMIIDGRTGVRGHGGPMPIWGDRYQASMLEERGLVGAEIYARGRLVALVEYIQTLQE
ncbi:MAG: cytochrome c [Maritimibacter sp.]